MAEQLHFEDIREGFELPVMVKNASRAQLFVYSAITWNPHRIHYDKDYAAVEGHPDIIVHGPLQGAWLTQFVQDWAGPRGRVLHLSWQNRARAFPEEDHLFKGTVTACYREGDQNFVELDVREENSRGEVLMPGKAKVSLPSRRE